MSLKEKIYNIVICVLAIVSVIFAVYDITKGLTPVMFWIDTIIYIIFVIDYFTRLILSKEKKHFIKSNIFDLIAIIPFNSAFRIFRTLKFARMLKFTKLLKVSSLSARGLSKTKKFLNVNGFKYVLLATFIAILLGTIGMMNFENMNFQDALWWSFVTATTVGYGDLSPSTGAGRIIASFLMLVGIGLIGSLTSTITSFFLSNNDETIINSDKIDMVKTLYDKLSESEKEDFIKLIKK